MTKAESQNHETVEIMGNGETITPEVLVRKYASAVFGICMAHTKNLHDSEDIMQDVFFKAINKFKTLRNHDRARSWLLKITRRTCVDYYRNRIPNQTVSDEIPAPIDTKSENIARLHKAISKLPDGFREPITLFYLNGKKCVDAAKILGISEEAVRSRLVRARLRLHELLVEEKS